MRRWFISASAVRTEWRVVPFAFVELGTTWNELLVRIFATCGCLPLRLHRLAQNRAYKPLFASQPRVSRGLYMEVWTKTWTERQETRRHSTFLFTQAPSFILRIIALWIIKYLAKLKRLSRRICNENRNERATLARAIPFVSSLF